MRKKNRKLKSVVVFEEKMKVKCAPDLRCICPRCMFVPRVFYYITIRFLVVAAGTYMGTIIT